MYKSSELERKLCWKKATCSSWSHLAGSVFAAVQTAWSTACPNPQWFQFTGVVSINFRSVRVTLSQKSSNIYIPFFQVFKIPFNKGLHLFRKMFLHIFQVIVQCHMNSTVLRSYLKSHSERTFLVFGIFLKSANSLRMSFVIFIWLQKSNIVTTSGCSLKKQAFPASKTVGKSRGWGKMTTPWGPALLS